MASRNAPARDAKLAHYLGEAFSNEKRLETALQAHIATAKRAPYKRRLRQHLTETRNHARELSRRIKQLGGTREPLPGPLSDAAGVVLEGAHKATALAQAPLNALRGTSEEERQLKSARTEYAEEAQEMGIYSAIETLAVAVQDNETAQLARTILRDERRMFTFLEREIPRLSEAVARAEIPAPQRNGGIKRAARKANTARTPRASASRSSRRSGSSARAGVPSRTRASSASRGADSGAAAARAPS
jgi:ferritin-like metal-binding protein YciE